MTAIKKTKEQLDAEVPAGSERFERDTKVVALRTGYSDVIREQGDVFYVKAGTIVGPNCWFKKVADNTSTTDEESDVEDMTVPQLKVALAEAGVDFSGITKKPDLVALLLKAQAGEKGEDLT